MGEQNDPTVDVVDPAPDQQAGDTCDAEMTAALEV